MNDYTRQQIDMFFSAIAPWREAYANARLHYLAVRQDQKLLMLSARIYLTVNADAPRRERFQAGKIEAGQWDFPQDQMTVEQAVAALLSPEGLDVEGHGKLALASTDYEKGISASSPMLLHPEGLNDGNRLAVFSVSGGQRFSYLPQPETDWILRAGKLPFDTINELSLDYGLGSYRGDLAQLEVVAHTAVQVSIRSAIQGNAASIGIWMSKGLDKAKARIGYRVLDKGIVVQRGAVVGSDLTWEEDAGALVGLTKLDIPLGAVVQCIAAYDEHAHHVRWFVDPAVFQNPRAAVLSSVDQTGQLLRTSCSLTYLQRARLPMTSRRQSVGYCGCSVLLRPALG